MRVQLPNGAPCRISSKVEPAIDNREALVRFQHPAPILLSSRGDWQRWQMHSTLNRDEAGSIPASRTRVIVKRRHSITDECAELLPRMMRVQISLPLPMWG